MPHASSTLRAVLAVTAAAFVSGCAVSGASLRAAAIETVTEPRVWVPLAGAMLLQVDDFDTRTSSWARRHTPVFGSTESADQWSDRLRAVPALAEAGAVLAAPLTEDGGGWFVQKAELAAVDAVGVGATMALVKGMKQQTGRLRPNGADRESLPSGHAAAAAANGRLAQLNLDALMDDTPRRRAAELALDAVEYGTAWARVEAGWHYPSDALVGLGMGNFVSAFVHRGALGDGSSLRLSMVPERGGARVTMALRF